MRSVRIAGVKRVFLSMVCGVTVLPFLWQCSSPLVFGNDTKTAVTNGLSEVILKSVSFSNTYPSTGFVPSGTPVTATVTIINPQNLNVVYSLRSNLAAGSFTSAPPSAPTPSTPTSLSITFTLDSPAEWKDLTFTLGKVAPSIGKTFVTDTFTIHCDSPPDPVGTLVVTHDTATTNAFMAFTLPTATIDNDAASVIVTYQDTSASGSITSETYPISSLTTNSYATDPLGSVTSTKKRYFTPSVVAGHDYTFTVTVVDQAGQKSSTSSGNSGVSEYTLTFDDNYTGAPATTTEINFPNVTMALPTPTRSGYLFLGWNTASGGTGTLYTGSTIINNLGDATLYAQWTILPTVSLTVALGSFQTLTFSSPSTSVAAGSTVTITPTFSNGSGWQWYIDGTLAGSSSTFTYTPSAAGLHNLSCTVTDSSTGISYSGYVTVTVTQ